jgi:hypothetical protein
MSTPRPARYSQVCLKVCQQFGSATSYKDLFRQTLPRANSRAPLLSLPSKLLNKLIGERDWSAQEVSHILHGFPLHEGSCQAMTLDCRPEKDQAEQLIIEGEDIRKGQLVLQKYNRGM